MSDTAQDIHTEIADPLSKREPPRRRYRWVSTEQRKELRSIIAGRGLFGRFGYLVATQFVTILFGIGYWTIGARLIRSSQVGIAAAAIAAASLIATVGVLGISTVLLVALQNQKPKEQRAFISTSMMVGAPVIIIITVGVCLLSNLFGPSLRHVGHSPVEATLMVSGATLTMFGSLIDSAALALQRSPERLIRNATASILKVVFVLVLVLIGVRNTIGLLAGWNVSMALSFAISPLMLKLPKATKVTFRQRANLVRDFWRLSLGHHAVNLAIGSMSYLLPFVAALFILPKQVAYFTVSQLVASCALMLPYLLAVTLFIESPDDSELLRKNIRKTFPLGVLCCVAILAVFEPGAHLVLSIFSSEYAAHGTSLLRLLLLGGLPYVIKDHYVAIRRAQSRLNIAAKVGVVTTLFETSAAALGAYLGGITWLCGAWALSTAVEAAVLSPVIVRIIFGSSPQRQQAKQTIHAVANGLSTKRGT